MDKIKNLVIFLLFFLIPIALPMVAWHWYGFFLALALLIISVRVNLPHRYFVVLYPLVGGIALFFSAPWLGLPVLLHNYAWPLIYWAICYLASGLTAKPKPAINTW